MPTRTNQAFGERIKAARKQAGLTQSELAKRIGLSQTTISRFEAAKDDVSLSHMVALAAALDHTLTVLLEQHETN